MNLSRCFLFAACWWLFACASAVEAQNSSTPKTVAFSVEVSGKGPPMILLPGVSAAAAMWDGTVAHYRSRYECHVFSFAGFAGQPALSLKPNESYLETMARELMAYIKTRRLRQPIIVGHSVGGLLALRIAVREPALVGKIVAVDSLAFLGAIMDVDSVEQAKPLAEKMRDAIGNVTAEEWRRNSQPDSPYLKMLATASDKIALAAKWSEDSDPHTVAQVMYEMMTTDARNELSAVKAPVLVFASWIAYAPDMTRDKTEQSRREQFAKLKDWRLRITDTARHFVMLDDEPWMLREVDDFLGARRKDPQSKD